MTTFYDSLEAGHDYHSAKSGNFIQRYWHSKKFEYMRQAAGIKATDRVLDVGCGSGAFLESLPPCKKKGIDNSIGQLGFAKKLGLDVIQSEANQLPIPDNSMDVVFSSELIEHIPLETGQQMIKEFFRVLTPGGKVVLTTPNYRSLWPIIEEVWSRTGSIDYRKIHLTHYSKKRIQAEFQQAGFSKIQVNSFFLLAPFISFVPHFAEKWGVIENKINKGSLLLVVAHK